MTFLALRETIRSNIFTFVDVVKAFSAEEENSITMQLSRFARKDLIHSLKKGLYCFDPSTIDELEVAHYLYSPSYLSLETALHYYGLIPDIPQAVTSITTVTTKKIITENGTFYYTRIKLPLYFGYHSVLSPTSGGYFSIAKKEKALLDYLYIRKLTSLADLRLNTKSLDMAVYKAYAQHFPSWVQEVVV